MGRDSGDSARLLARLTSGPSGPSGWSAPSGLSGVSGWSDGDEGPPGPGAGPPGTDPDPFPRGTGEPSRGGRRGGGRHLGGSVGGGGPGWTDAGGRDAGGRGGGWRLLGVPPGLAVLLLVVAVVGVLLLGRGGGSDEVLVGPVGDGTVGVPTVDDAAAGTVGGEVAGAEGSAGTGAPDPAVVGDVVTDGAGGGPGADGAGAAGTAAPAPASGPLLVHVDGAVARPGVVELPAGARVGDAVLAAGGATDEADTRLVNLARPLTDGELVVVPRPGEQAATAGAATGGAGAGAAGVGGAGAGTSDGGPVDLNTADAAALDALPGIGPVLAERIVTWREESGPFSSVDDLTAVSGIGPAVLADVRDLVTV